MRRLVIASILATVVLLAGVGPATVGAATAQEASCEYPVTLTDTTGAAVTVEGEPDRIVALQPSDAQIVYEIGADDRLVGMTINEYTAYLEDRDRAEDVTSGGEVDNEVVIGLEPDLVLASNVTDPERVQQLRDAGLTIYYFEEASSIEDVEGHTRVVGQLTGECDAAERTVDWMNERLGIVEATVEDAIEGAVEDDVDEQPLIFWHLGFGWTAGPGTFQHELIETVGGENLAERAGISGWDTISAEVVIEEDPAWVVYTYDPLDPDAEPELDDAVYETTAWENGQLVGVNANHINQPAPRIVLAAEETVETMYPEAYAAAIDDAGTVPWDEAPPSTTVDGEDRSTTVDEGESSMTVAEEGPSAAVDDDDPISGFGVSVVIVALAAVVSLGIASARRR